MSFREKFEAAKQCKISLPENILDNDIVGVYGIFANKEDSEDICFYIGKATNIRNRLLLSGGHVYRYLHEDYSWLVPKLIKEYIENGYEIEVRILKEVNYEDECFSRAAHILAFEELKYITEYQKKGQCLTQKPEGVGKNEEAYWNENYKRNK